MSHIFDALLKSEADHGNNNGDAGSALELLLRAERLAALQRKTELISDEAIGAELTDTEPVVDNGFDRSTFPTAPTADGTAHSTIATSAASRREQRRASEPPAIPELDADAALGGVRTLKIVLPQFSRLVAVADKTCPAAEAFRLLSVRLRHFRKDRPLQKLLITSTVPQEGKSFSAANLACTIATVTQQKVLLIDADLRRPAQPPIFGLENMPGMSEWLQGTAELRSTVYYLEGPSIWFLPAGIRRSNPLELLQSPRVPMLLQEASRFFDWIIIDSPPILPFADTSVLARLADGILLVTRIGITERRQLKQGVAAIEKSKILGAIINSSVKYHRQDYYYYYSSDSKSPSE